MKKEVPINDAHRLINTGCVLLVTSADEDRENVMTLAWHTPVSSKPLLLGIAVAASHFTTELINKSREFVLNIPGANLLNQVGKCGEVIASSVDEELFVDSSWNEKAKLIHHLGGNKYYVSGQQKIL
ncbi:flavin reductase like protein [Keratinibaculum paraultunense]|uniref:Flavin reductase like protein n=1 Tax=Keratinibaculum paraultunense TaxID=1278232 RepID=A0A4V2UUI0_9FIRM|nr:flavin reductase [Keratinibaculum paraultunense]QQY80305.1 flavin reductase [Keratinibaculum paraultunense]TCS90826.1 flavin reductase like protein [Keratinibaculum paraultunense]